MQSSILLLAYSLNSPVEGFINEKQKLNFIFHRAERITVKVTPTLSFPFFIFHQKARTENLCRFSMVILSEQSSVAIRSLYAEFLFVFVVVKN